LSVTPTHTKKAPAHQRPGAFLFFAGRRTPPQAYFRRAGDPAHRPGGGVDSLPVQGMAGVATAGPGLGGGVAAPTFQIRGSGLFSY